MKMDLRIQAKMSHQLVMTPQLQQAIKLLQLSHQELEKLIDQSITENPALEIVNNSNAETTTNEAPSQETKDKYDSPTDSAKEETPESSNNEDEWQDYFQQGGGVIKESNKAEDEGSDDYMFVEQRSLKSYLEWQIEVASFLEEEKTVAFILAGYINENGYLTASIDEMVAESNLLKEILQKPPFNKHSKEKLQKIDKKYFYLKYQEEKDPKKNIDDFPAKLMFEQSLAKKHDDLKTQTLAEKTPLPKEIDESIFLNLDNFIRKLQTLEPPGVFARSLQECLVIQAKQEMPDDLIVNTILDKYFDKLVKQELNKIAKVLKVSLDEVIAAKKRIISLEPKPGRKYNTDPVSYVVPDVFIFKKNNKYVVKVNNNNIPKLSINNYYKQLSDKMAKSYSRQKNKSDDMQVLTSQYLVEKIRAAEWLIKSIDQRQKTILRVSESIVKRQQDFFDKGVGSLKPMVLKDVAEDIGVHESTVSRITSNKYMHSPQGIFELKYFFTSGIMQEDGYFISSEKIKDLISKMINNETPTKALTDSELARKLEKEMNIKVARRTVAKYREAMRIEPSNRRRRKF